MANLTTVEENKIMDSADIFGQSASTEGDLGSAIARPTLNIGQTVACKTQSIKINDTLGSVKVHIQGNFLYYYYWWSKNSKN